MPNAGLPPSTGRMQWPVRATFGPLLRAYFKMDVAGAHNVPASGPAIFAPKHDSMWDVPLLVVASPRPIVFMAKEAVFGTPFKRWFFTELGGFPIERAGSAIRSGLEVLAAGRVLGVFPEGTRTPGRLGLFRSGAAWLALMTGAPIVPTAISGTSGIWRRGAAIPRRSAVRVRFGEPIEVPRVTDPKVRKRRAPELAMELRGAVESLLAG